MRRFVVLGFLAMALGVPTQAYAHGMPHHLMSRLSGGHETPAVQTDATGVAFFTLSEDGKTLHYVLRLHNIKDVMAAHIHMMQGSSTGGMSGGKGMSGGSMNGMSGMSGGGGMSGMSGGGMVAMLYSSEQPSGAVDGTLAKGDITSADLMGALAGHPLSDFVDAAMHHQLYVNVHTMEHKGGEVSGMLHGRH